MEVEHGFEDEEYRAGEVNRRGLNDDDATKDRVVKLSFQRINIMYIHVHYSVKHIYVLVAYLHEKNSSFQSRS